MHGDDQSFFRRFLHGIGGQAYLRTVYFVSTIAAVPILIGEWGTKGYGTWLVLTALAVYMAVSTTGLSSASSVEMLQAVGARDEPRAQRAFVQSVNLLGVLMTVIIAPMLLAAYFLPLQRLLNLSDVTDWDVFLILCFMAFQVWAVTMRLVIGSAISTVGRYGVSEAIAATAKLCELSMLIFFVIVLHGGLVWAAAAVAIASFLDVTVNLLVCFHWVPWARFDFTKLDMSWAREFLRPTMGNFVLSVAVSAVIIQAPRVVLSIVVGPAAVAIYGVYAGAMRMMEQFTGLVISTVIMEVAREIGRKRLERVQLLVTSAIQFATTCALSVSLGLLALGPLVFEVWTRNKVAFDYRLMALFLFTGLVVQLGKVGQVYLVGSNRILRASILMFFGACLGVTVGGLLAPHWGGAGMGLGGLVGEVAITTVGIAGTAQGIRMPVWQLFAQSARIDIGLAMLLRKIRGAATS